MAATPKKNFVIFVADGLRPDAVNLTDTPTLYNLRQQGVNFTNSHSLFPTFTTPNAAAIATGHYLGDTGDFSNTIYTGVPIAAAGGSATPFIENNPILGDIDEKFPGNNFLNEESVLAAARMAGYDTAAVGKLGPTLLQDVTQGNPVNGVVPTPNTVVLDDSTGTAGAGLPLRVDIAAALTAAGLPTKTPNRTNGADPNSQQSNVFNGVTTKDGVTTVGPGTLAANTAQQQFFADATTKAILPTFEKSGNPFGLVYWSRDPDGTQHNQGDSFQTLTPGINGPTVKAAVKNTDNNLKQLLDKLKNTKDADGNSLADTTDVFVTADHGFSTISKSFIDANGTKTNSYASTLDFSKAATPVPAGQLPKGFVAIDLARALNLPLYDPDTKATGTALSSDGKTVTYKAVDPTKGELPANGNGFIGGDGFKDGQPNAQVIVAANGGSDLIYLPDNDRQRALQVVDFLSKQDYISGIFVDDVALGGSIPGALSLKDINLKGMAQTPTPSIVINFKTFSTDPKNPNLTQVEIADTALSQGQGMHGSFGKGDTFNNMTAIGPDFKKGYTDVAPVSNADVAPTIAKAVGLPLDGKGSLVGRTIDEALVGGPNNVKSSNGIAQSQPNANGVTTQLDYQTVGDTKYFDAAGFAGKTVGLKNPSPTTPVKDVTKDGAMSASDKMVLPVKNLNSDKNNLLDLRAEKGQVEIKRSNSQNPDRNNSIGFYRIDDATGKIGNLKPGDAGYIEAALKQSLVSINQGADKDVTLASDELYAPYLIANGTVEDFFTKNPTNQSGDKFPQAYFSFIGANPDRAEHIRTLGDGKFGFEDAFGGGDRDFNDAVAQIYRM
jgi:arylsulfatase A-like enzyme